MEPLKAGSKIYIQKVKEICTITSSVNGVSGGEKCILVTVKERPGLFVVPILEDDRTAFPRSA